MVPEAGRGGGGNFTCPLYCTGLCHFLGYLLPDSVWIYEYGFQQALHFPDL